MKKKKLKLKQSAKLTVAATIFVIAMILLFVKCVIEIIGHHYTGLYFGIGCATLLAIYLVIVIISDAIEETKKTQHKAKYVESSKLKNKKFTTK